MVHKKGLKTKQKFKLMYAVVYDAEEGISTFEIFDNMKDAKKFKENNNGYMIFKAPFNTELIWKEGKNWQYDDRADLYNNAVTVEMD